MLLPQRLKQLRLEHDLTQEELSQRMPINRGTYAHYELGKRQPDLDTLVHIAKFYDVSTDYLLGLTDLPISVSSLYRYCQRQSGEYPFSPEAGSERVAEGQPKSSVRTRRQQDGRSNRGANTDKRGSR